MKYLDGTFLEGGGQCIIESLSNFADIVLRNSAAYACILSEEITVYNIRQNRRQPGLKSQHLKGLELLCKISSGELVGGWIASREIILRPGEGNQVVEFTATCKG